MDKQNDLYKQWYYEQLVFGGGGYNGDNFVLLPDVMSKNPGFWIFYTNITTLS